MPGGFPGGQMPGGYPGAGQQMPGGQPGQPPPEPKKEEPKKVNPPHMPEPQGLDPVECNKKGEEAFAAKNYIEAIEQYTLAIAEVEMKNASEVYYANRADAYLEDK